LALVTWRREFGRALSDDNIGLKRLGDFSREPLIGCPLNWAKFTGRADR